MTSARHTDADFYPRPPRGGRPPQLDQSYLASSISIHALREEGDGSTSGWTSGTTNFYPRPPRGGRPAVYNAMLTTCKFLSTPSARRATFQAGLFAAHHDISIHALREEGDPNLQHLSISFFEFLSTPSARRATHLFADGAQEGVISIHALREEGDAARP